MSDSPIFDNVDKPAPIYGNLTDPVPVQKENDHGVNDTTPNKWIHDPAIRRWIYGILVALAAIAVAYGIVTIEQSGLWLALAGAILGLGNVLAARNTPKG